MPREGGKFMKKSGKPSRVSGTKPVKRDSRNRAVNVNGKSLAAGIAPDVQKRSAATVADSAPKVSDSDQTALDSGEGKAGKRNKSK